MKIRYILVALLAVLALRALAAYEPQVFKDVKSGVVQLQCEFSDGTRIVDPERVVGYYPDQGHWKFDNGGSKTCIIVE